MGREEKISSQRKGKGKGGRFKGKAESEIVKEGWRWKVVEQIVIFEGE